MAEALRIDLQPQEATASPPSGPALVGYIEDMLLELAHMAAAGGEGALAASLGIAAIQAGARRQALSPA